MNDSLDCLQAYKEYLIEREMSENTIEKYLRDVRAFVRYMGGRELERAEVLRYKKELLAQYKITSANSMLTALNHFFKWLGRNELCMKTCRQQRQIFRDAEKDLTREEYRRLLQTAGREEREASVSPAGDRRNRNADRRTELPDRGSAQKKEDRDSF